MDLSDSNAFDPNAKVTNTSTVLVKPEVERDSEWVDFTKLDFFPYYSTFVFVYKAKEDSAVLDGLIKALAKTLVPFYPMAGRLVKTKDSPTRLHCNNEGALFIHKRYDGAVSELVNEDDHQPSELLSGLSGIDHEAESYPPDGLPVLVVQVIDFLCGSMTLTVSYSHLVADGFSGAHFIKSWAEICRGEPISLMPVHDRSLLSPRKSSPVMDGAKVRFLHSVPLENTSSKPTSTGSLPVPPSLPEPLKFKTLRYSREEVAKLKAQVQGTPALTTADCVSAHLWRTIIGNRNFDHEEPTRFITMVNCRSKMKDFPAGYFGNCVIVTNPMTTVGELLTKPLSYAASLIHDAVSSVDEEVVRGWVDFFELHGFNFKYFGDEPFIPSSGNPVLQQCVSSWMTRFPYFELDFGLGTPTFLTRNSHRMAAASNGMFHALPTRSTSTQGDFIVQVFAEQSLCEVLSSEM